MKFVPGVPEPGQTVYGERPGRIEYLYLTARQKNAVRLLNDAIDELPPLTRLRCQVPVIKEQHGKTIEYYAHTDYDERTPPTERQAELMCKTNGIVCPVAELCNALGNAIEAPVGIWGGRVLVDGEDYYERGNNG